MPATSIASIRVRDEVAALKRERTIDVAAELFYERGYENTSLDVIAEHMGVTKPFIYAHFSSKAELLAEICSRGIESSLQAMTRVLDRPGPPAALLAEMCRLFVRAVLDNQRHIAIFAREEKNLAAADFKRISDMRREFDARLVDLLDEGVSRGDFRLADTRMAALAIGGMVSWAYVWYRPDGRLQPADLADSMTALVMGMVGARPSRSSAAAPAPVKPAAVKLPVRKPAAPSRRT